MKKTKIICTIGPASKSVEILRQMALAGMNVARINFSHGTYEEHKEKMDNVKIVRKELGLPIAIMLDTKGPEFRIGRFKDGKIQLKKGNDFIFTTEDILGDETKVSVSYQGLINDLSVGDMILVNNGLIEFKVTKLEGNNAYCKVLTSGSLSDRKSMSFPNKVMRQVYLSEQDKQDLLFGIANDIDYVACSFVSEAQNLLDIRCFLDENGGKDIQLVAKIENRSGIDNIESIMTVSDGIMVARGDMGVEVPFEQLPAIQKRLILIGRLAGQRVITATEMLESMVQNPRPTRAEISDVANAVYDGSSAIMLSAETAVGQYPVLTVQTMAKIAEETENNINYKANFRNSDFKIKDESDAVSHATVEMAMDLKADLIVVCTKGGMTARMVSRFRPPMHILGMTTDEKVYRQLALSWGVVPAMSDIFQSTDVLFYHAVNCAKKTDFVKKGSTLVLTAGVPIGISGNTNLIKVEKVN